MRSIQLNFRRGSLAVNAKSKFWQQSGNKVIYVQTNLYGTHGKLFVTNERQSENINSLFMVKQKTRELSYL